MTDVHIKNEQEIQVMRRAGQLLGKFLNELKKKVEVGVTPLDIEHHAESLFEQYGVEPGFKGFHGYPNICCISVNNDVVHGIPNDRPLKKGDLITIDCGVKIDGLNTDAAVSVIVGGDAAGSEKTQKLNTVTRKAMFAGIKMVKPGNKLGDIGHAIQTVVEKNGLSIIKDLTGHGIGYELHESPQVLNYGKKGKGLALKPGMTIAIEPIVSAGKRFIKTSEDRWTIQIEDGSWGCQWEHTVLVTPNGHEILTEYTGS